MGLLDEAASVSGWPHRPTDEYVPKHANSSTALQAGVTELSSSCSNRGSGYESAAWNGVASVGSEQGTSSSRLRSRTGGHRAALFIVVREWTEYDKRLVWKDCKRRTSTRRIQVGQAWRWCAYAVGKARRACSGQNRAIALSRIHPLRKMFVNLTSNAESKPICRRQCATAVYTAKTSSYLRHSATMCARRLMTKTNDNEWEVAVYNKQTRTRPAGIP